MLTPKIKASDRASLEPQCALPCFTAAEWSEYAKAAGPYAARQACRDCSPRFQGDALRRGLCAHPEVRFRWTPHDGVVGTHPDEPEYPQREPMAA